jgi:hypothetical protein
MAGLKESDLRDFVGYEIRSGKQVAVFTKSLGGRGSEDFVFNREGLEGRLRRLQASGMPYELTEHVLLGWPATQAPQEP